MRSNFFKLFLLITALSMSNGILFAQYTWTKYQGNPVIPSGPSGSWYRGVITPCVIYNEDLSRYEMWFAGSATTYGERPLRIGFAYSNDGISWVIHPNQIVAPRPGNWDNYSVYAPWVIRENGQYKMWYTHEAPGYTDYKLGYATSPDGINWTRLDNPVMEAGTAEWEAQGVGLCNVLPGTGGYKMWYSGLAGTSDTTSIGYAFSTDGISWQRDTVNNPILTPGSAGQWDDFNIFAPRVIILDNIYYMYYGASRQTFAQYRVGLATSTDGINWEKFWDNPILRPSPSGWDNGEVETACIIKIGDTLKLWYDASNSGTYHWQIGLATSYYLPNALAPGTYTVGTGGNFATIQDAFNKLETDGVAGNVILELIDELYIAPTDSFGFKLNGPIPGAGPNSRVTIKPAENKNVTIQGSGIFVMYLMNTNYLTFDGVSVTGATTLTFRALYNNQFVYNNGLCFMNNSDYNIVQNTIFINESSIRMGVVLGFYTTLNAQVVADSNLIQSNFIKQAGVGIYIGTNQSAVKPTGNIIEGNVVGSETDSLIGWGIQVERNQNAIIEDNVIQSIRATSAAFVVAHGINCYGCTESTIRNNIVHNVNTSYNNGSAGIALTGDGSTVGNGNLLYNNMVYDINSSSSASYSNIGGINLEYQNNTKVYYNSVYLSSTGANHLGSAALYLLTNVTNTEAKNNILVNTRDESPYCASAIYDYTASNLSSDYNDLYYDDNNNNNCLVRIAGTDYLTLADWQAQGKDQHSYVEMPHFVEPYLHIDSTFATYLESRGTPIAGIETDFDGQLRNALTPDIGADEMNGIVGVKDEEALPTEFALEQNYPNPFNPSTVISYQLPVSSEITLKVYDILGNEIAALVNEYKSAGRYEIEFGSHSGLSGIRELTSGVYFYQLKAGEFVSTKKMILLK